MVCPDDDDAALRARPALIRLADPTHITVDCHPDRALVSEYVDISSATADLISRELLLNKYR